MTQDQTTTDTAAGIGCTEDCGCDVCADARTDLAAEIRRAVEAEPELREMHAARQQYVPVALDAAVRVAAAREHQIRQHATHRHQQQMATKNVEIQRLRAENERLLEDSENAARLLADAENRLRMRDHTWTPGHATIAEDMARAMYAAGFDPGSWDDLPERNRQRMVRQAEAGLNIARAVLGELRAKAVVLPDDWREQIPAVLRANWDDRPECCNCHACKIARIVETLVESWSAHPAGEGSDLGDRCCEKPGETAIESVMRSIAEVWRPDDVELFADVAAAAVRGIDSRPAPSEEPAVVPSSECPCHDTPLLHNREDPRCIYHVPACPAPSEEPGETR